MHEQQKKERSLENMMKEHVDDDGGSQAVAVAMVVQEIDSRV